MQNSRIQNASSEPMRDVHLAVSTSYIEPMAETHDCGLNGKGLLVQTLPKIGKCGQNF